MESPHKDIDTHPSIGISMCVSMLPNSLCVNGSHPASTLTLYWVSGYQKCLNLFGASIHPLLRQLNVTDKPEEGGAGS